MSDVTITVRGEHETRVAPEEALVHLAVRTDGPDRADVMARATDAASNLRAALTAREAGGEVREWSTGRLMVRSERPWNADGAQLPLVHHASLEMSASFASLDAVSGWLSEIAEQEAVHIGDVEWLLTPATATATEAQVAAEAVRVAISRATAYAAAIGRAEITPIEIADVGLLRGGEQPSTPAPRMMRASFAADAPASLTLEPADIVVSAAVEARFTAR
jgi:uncharacterized protein YggE